MTSSTQVTSKKKNKNNNKNKNVNKKENKNGISCKSEIKESEKDT